MAENESDPIKLCAMVKWCRWEGIVKGKLVVCYNRAPFKQPIRYEGATQVKMEKPHG